VDVVALHIKKGDMVEIIAGDNKGATGRVLRVYPDENKVVIQGQNLVKKHVKPSRKSPHGGRISIEQPIHISNVLPLNPKTSKGSRVHYVIGRDGGKKRIAKDGAEIGVVRKAK
jgi:large subunit ribosomal protein L24